MHIRFKIDYRIRRCFALLLALLPVLIGCQNTSAPVQPPPPTAAALTFIWIPDLLRNVPAQNQIITTVGYMLVDQAGATLVDAILYDVNGTPRRLDTGTPALWLGPNARSQFQGSLRSAGRLEYASVVARAQVSGPGSYGPGGRYSYQLANFTLEPLAAQETTIEALLGQPANYEGRLVRLVGSLLVRQSSGLLVDKLGTGGIPAPKSRQLKLRTPISDRSLLDRLKSAPGGLVHFGQGQVEGFWRNGTLAPLSITLTS